MKRPELNQIPLRSTADFIQPGKVCVTMSVGQWDALLEESYNRGYFLLELNENEYAVALYKKPDEPVALKAAL